jgi:hypothetical protein
MSSELEGSKRRYGFVLAGLLVLTSSALAQEILYSNMFQVAKDRSRPEGWALIGRTEPDYWYVTNGWFCTGNGDNFPDSSAFAIIDEPKASSWSNYMLRCDFWMDQQIGQIHLVGRWQDPNNYYLATLSSGQTTRDPAYAELVKMLGGQRMVLKTVTDGREGVRIPSFAGGKSYADSHRLEFSVAGNQLGFSIDGVSLIRINDDSFSKGTCGLGQKMNMVYFDNVVVMAMAGPSATAPPVSAPMQPPTGPPAGLITMPQGMPLGAIYRLLIMEGLDQGTADQVRTRMIAQEYSPVEVIQDPGGTFSVYLGAFGTEEEANRAKDRVEREDGLAPQRVVRLSGQQAIDTLQAASLPAAQALRLRVLAEEFTDNNLARAMETNLVENGYFPVDVVSEGGKLQVLCGPGFINRADAELLAADLQQSGYFAARVTEVAPEAPLVASAPPISGQPGVGPSAAPLIDPGRQLGFQPTQDEVERARRIREQQMKATEGLLSYDDYQRLIEEIKKLDRRTADLLTASQQRDAEQRQKDLRVRELKRALDSHKDTQNFAGALQILDEWERLDPTNNSIAIERRFVQARMAGRSVDQDILDRQQQGRLQAKVKEAEEAEKASQYELAMARWSDVRAEARGGLYDTATDRIKNLQQVIDKQRAEQERSTRAQKRIITIAVLSVVGLTLVVAAVLILMMVRGRKRDQELLRQVQELTIKPIKDIEEGAAPKLLETEEPPPPAPLPAPTKAKTPIPAAAPPAPAPAPAPIPVSAAGIFGAPSAPAPAPAPASASAKPAVAAPETPRVFAPPEIPVSAPESAPEKEPEPVFATSDIPGAALAFDSIGGLNLDDILGKDTVVTPLPVASSRAEAPPPAKAAETLPLPGFADLPTIILPEGAEVKAEETIPISAAATPVVSAPATSPSPPPPPPPVAAPPPAAPVPAPAVAAAAVPSGDRTVFAQNFNDETEGEIPKGWTGQYDYASLVVSSQTPAPGSKKCMRFEKRSGSGSAYFSCRFPEIEGKVGVEFDLRCDDKNKYLLGFYIEKDEDFRQSIHTIVHRTSPQVSPTLRVQGEPTQYSLGTWRHMKYEIDLKSNTVNGFVDGTLVASGVKLATPPSSVNTLSIRDNLATTGILLIDNIRIYKFD